MVVSDADKAFRDRQAMIDEFSPIPLGYAFLRCSWEKNGIRATIWRAPATAEFRNAQKVAGRGARAGLPRADSLGDNANMTRGPPSTML
ncbi:hypothetical protein [Pandoraea sp. 64-18]|uniref:hypothetical protein n=1 Tax=Pandoraea sp. 64-18 TaxID=1895806 RepID=UPI0009695DDF|nr:hypothetical protein [Pandoraea sp. 64-18]OJY22438.1 MAG: hypothetical protein BGP02_01230 [Pandoraea sp. 64-18]